MVRLRPVLMTALVARSVLSYGVGNRPGAEVQRPLATGSSRHTVIDAADPASAAVLYGWPIEEMKKRRIALPICASQQVAAVAGSAVTVCGCSTAAC